MRHYYIVIYKSEINDNIIRRITYDSRASLFNRFNKSFYRLLSFTKITKAEAKYFNYKFDK